MKILPILAILSAAVAAAPIAHPAAPDAWTKNCAACHGADGTGHTRAGRMAGVKDMTAADYQAKFTDADAVKRITDGLKDANGKVKMKAFGQTLSADDINGLVAYVRSLKK